MKTMTKDEYIPRLIDKWMKIDLNAIGAIFIEGPRGCGKTSTGEFFSKTVFKLDKNNEIRLKAENTPEILFANDKPILIDEWQLVGSIWNAVRNEIDNQRQQGLFILTGSSAPKDDKTRHTGVGRIGRLKMTPMSLYESKNSSQEVNFANLFNKEQSKEIKGGKEFKFKDYAYYIIRGGWPQYIQKDEESSARNVKHYVNNLFDADLRYYKSRLSKSRLSALIRSLSRNLSTNAALRTLAEDALIDSDTVRKYLDRLSDIYVLDELPVWNTHIRSSAKLRVKPKWHFTDPSIAAASLGINSDDLINELNTFGLFFESLAIRDIRAYAFYLDGEVSYYLDSSDLEVDAIVEMADGRWAAFEMKLGGETLIEQGAINLHLLKKRLNEKQLDKLISLNVITAGNVSYTRPDGINVIALGHLFVK
ncbi:MAG: DUF4143 domain-containing protein [Mycoplasmataceae bacterium]|nr:DUF4143 domain-containing protein [Mycoplasmataceae bacterium]